MRKYFLLILSLLVVATITYVLITSRTNIDMILTNGIVYTLDDNNHTTEAVAISGDRIVGLGSTADILDKYRADTVIDLKGKSVYPGFIDGHAHILGEGGRLQNLDLVGTKSAEQIAGMVKERVNNTKAGEWIVGRGWDQNDWHEMKFPTAQVLDSVSPRNPVLLRRVDGHAAWTNSAAMKLASLTETTEDPTGGKIIRNANGRPTGVFIDNAIDLVSKAIPSLTEEEIGERLKLALDECASFGLTEVHDMGVGLDVIRHYKRLIDAGKCPIRIYGAIDYGGETWKYYLEHGPENTYGGGFLSIRAVKMYMDGALGSRGAALIEAYSDDPGNRGLTMMRDGEVDSACRDALAKGFQVCTHAIGDRANNVTLTAYERVLESIPAEKESPRWRVEHAQILLPEDISRFKKLGVLPSMQPTHATSDMEWVEARVGPERAKGAYAWRSILETGSIISGGSDFPAEFVNPLLGIYAAITRQDRNGTPPQGWYAEQKMTRKEALRAFTQWPAYAAFQEKEKGILEIGKWADLTILSKDIMKIPPGEILTTDVEMTIVGGRVVYRKETDGQ